MEINQQLKEYQNQFIFLLSVFPWLEEYCELPPEEAAMLPSSASDDYDHVRQWLSPDEYRSLPEARKNQLALDRYNKRPKSKWEIGREYERYIGYEFERAGMSVIYEGARKHLEDMGRDLLVEKADGSLLVVQCKHYAKEKQLHEKHIFQLYGTVTLLRIDSPDRKVNGLFVCSCSLSDTAKQCANALGILFKENRPLGEYPQIKCNISRSTGERIYHLPFDQQYDTVKVDYSAGERFVFTVKEAESMGFRHAKRHILNNT